MTAVAKAIRALAFHDCEIVLGFGQGAIVALALSRPRVVELALAARVVQPEESRELSPAWHRVRLAIAVEPLLLRATSRLLQLQLQQI